MDQCTVFYRKANEQCNLFGGSLISSFPLMSSKAGYLQYGSQTKMYKTALVTFVHVNLFLNALLMMK